MLLPDVNVWLALAFEKHSSHDLAKRWFDSLGNEPCYFCRLTQQGFLRLSTNPRAVGDSVVSLVGAWRLYDSILDDERISLVGEPQGVESA